MLIVLKDAIETYSKLILKRSHKYFQQSFSTAWVGFSPVRPSSRSSLGSSRLSCSHNSLSIPATRQADDSSFITQAVSHDALVSNQICDLYSVPLDGDVYAVPVDVVRGQPGRRPRRPNPRGPRRSSKRHSVTETAAEEPIHMTLQEVRQYLQTLYSSSSESSDHRINKIEKRSRANTHSSERTSTNYKYKENVTVQNGKVICVEENTQIKTKKNVKSKKFKESSELRKSNISNNEQERNKKCPVRSFSSSLKQTLCNLFRFRRLVGGVKCVGLPSEESERSAEEKIAPLAARALPPLPSEGKNSGQSKTSMDFATSIEKVKDVSNFFYFTIY